MGAVAILYWHGLQQRASETQAGVEFLLVLMVVLQDGERKTVMEDHYY